MRFLRCFSLMLVILLGAAVPVMAEEAPAPAAKPEAVSMKKMEKLAIQYKKEGKYAEAEPLLKKVLEMKTAKYGPEDPFTGATAISLAEVYKKQNKLDEAYPLFEQGLKMLEEPQYPDFDQVVRVLEELADICEQQGRSAEGIKFRERAFVADDKHRQILARETPETPQN